MLNDPQRLAGLLLDPDRPMQIVIAGKAHPADEGGKRLIQQMVRFADSRGRPPPDRLPARLRHGARPLPRPGLRRLAEQPAAPARGLRHLRHEGGAQRRPEPVGAGRLVGRVVRRRQRLGDPHRRRRRPTRRAATSSRRPRCTSCSPSRSRRCSTTPTPTACRSGWIEMVRHNFRSLGPLVQADRMVGDYVTTLYAPAARVVARAGGRRPTARPATSPRGRRASARPGRRCGSSTSRPTAPSRRLGAVLDVRVTAALGDLSARLTSASRWSTAAPGDDDEIVDPVLRHPHGGRTCAGASTPASPARSNWAARARSATPSGCSRHHPLLASRAELGLVTYPDAPAGMTNGDLR